MDARDARDAVPRMSYVYGGRSYGGCLTDVSVCVFTVVGLTVDV